MTPLAKAMEVVFLIAWFVGLASWLYSARYFLPMWAVGFRPREAHRGYRKRVLLSVGVFLAAIAVGFAAGAVAEYWGGGW